MPPTATTRTGSSMEPDGLLTGIFLHPLLTEAFKKFPSEEWEAAAEAAGIGVATVRSPGRGAGRSVVSG